MKEGGIILRRPICLMTGAFAAGIYTRYYFASASVVGAAGYFSIGAVILLALCVFCRFRFPAIGAGRGCVALFLVFFLLGQLFLSVQLGRTDPLTSMVGQRITLEGTVRSIEKLEEEKYRLLLKTTAEKSKILITVYGDIAVWGLTKNYGDLAGRPVSVTGIPALPAPRRNPKTFDYRQYLMTRGIQTIMSVNPAALEIKEGKPARWVNLISGVRCDFMEKVSAAAGAQTAAILAGMLLGDKNAMDEDLYEVFQKNGTAHVLAVSGLHVGIVYVCANALLKPRRSLWKNALLFALLLFYAALASFSPSAVRAAGMITLHLGATLLHRRYDLLCSTAAVCLTMLIFNPMSLFNPGFQLSFLAMATLSIVLPAAQRIYAGWVTAAAVIQVGMVPVTAYSFNTFSWVAVLANIPVVFLAGLIIPVGIFLIPVSCLSENLFAVGLIAAELLCEWMRQMNEFAYVPGVSFRYVTSPPLFALFCFYGFLFYGASESAFIRRQRGRRRRVAGCGAEVAAMPNLSTRPNLQAGSQKTGQKLRPIKRIMPCLLILSVALAAASYPQADFQKAGLVFVDVGQGDCLHIRTPGGQNILIDAGGSMTYDVGRKTVMPYLLKNGVGRIDLLLVSHRHLDHYGGAVSLANHLDVGQMGFYAANRFLEAEIMAETGLSAEHLLYLSKGDVIALDSGVWIEILYPEGVDPDDYERLTAEGSDENAISLIAKIHYGGTTVLMTGDLDENGEKRLIDACTEEELRTRIVKAAHHGSKYGNSSRFIQAANPEIAIFQVGKNNFGHPTPEAIDRYEEAGAVIFRNDLHGAIGVFIHDEKTVIRTILQ